MLYSKVEKEYYHWTLRNIQEKRRSLHSSYPPRDLHISGFYLNLWRRWLLEKATHAQLVKKFSASLNSKFSVFSSQVSATSLYLEANKSTLNPRIQPYVLILSSYYPYVLRRVSAFRNSEKHQQYPSHLCSKKNSTQFHIDVFSSSSCQTLDGKIKCSRYRPGVAQRVGRGIALLFHDRGTRRGWVVSSTPRPHFIPGKDPVPILQEAGCAPGPVWTGRKSRTHRDSIPDRPPLVSRYTNWATQPTDTRCTFNNIPWLSAVSPVDYPHSISRKTHSSLRIIYSHLHYLYPSSMKYYPETDAMKSYIKIIITIHSPALLTP